METLLQLLFITLLCLPFYTTAYQNAEPYVVYMGSLTRDQSEAEVETVVTAHLGLLSAVLGSEDRETFSLIHVYHHAFKGFSAMLTDEEATQLSGHEEIVSVFPDPTLQLHTTRSWDFLKSESGIQFNYRYPSKLGANVIIGVIDTGIWPESPSFNDDGIGQIPKRWKGVCMEGSDFNRSNCNRKLIGARYYNSDDNSNTTSGSPRDTRGHGTHTASTAAGAPVANASYYGLGYGTARGGSPSSRIAVYKACESEGCSGAMLLKALDDAIKDGVDIISISIGTNSISQPDFLNDPIAIGAFHANQKGVMVICSAGNDGPDTSTVVNSAPWLFTVAASSIDRNFQSSVVLGNKHVFKGTAINFSNLTHSKLYPLAYGRDIAAPSTPSSEASNCYPGSLDTEKVTGKIVVCIDTDPSLSKRIKRLVVEDAGAIGMIFIGEADKSIPFNSGVFPFSQVGNIDGYWILKYINSTKNPTASILPTVDVESYKPAPVIAIFSSRGPASLTETILKPDVTAPGVGILAAIIPQAESGSIPIGERPSAFGIHSGTSMACPHVSGAAALIKSIHPRWSSSMIKSALMTTAKTFDNMGNLITNSSNVVLNPHEAGSGEISPLRALNPGLVYKTSKRSYLYFLCYYGFKEKAIRALSGNNFKCPKKSSEDLISNLNYPSISISNLNRHGSARTIKRTVTNVGPKNSTYIVKVDSPKNLVVAVSPEQLRFSENLVRASYKVTFHVKRAEKGYKFGSITWSDGTHLVRSTFAVKVV